MRERERERGEQTKKPAIIACSLTLAAGKAGRGCRGSVSAFRRTWRWTDEKKAAGNKTTRTRRDEIYFCVCYASGHTVKKKFRALHLFLCLNHRALLKVVESLFFADQVFLSPNKTCRKMFCCEEQPVWWARVTVRNSVCVRASVLRLQMFAQQSNEAHSSTQCRLGLSFQIQILYDDWHISLWPTTHRENIGATSKTLLKKKIVLLGRAVGEKENLRWSLKTYSRPSETFFSPNSSDRFVLCRVPAELNELSECMTTTTTTTTTGTMTPSKKFRQKFFAPSHHSAKTVSLKEKRKNCPK